MRQERTVWVDVTTSMIYRGRRPTGIQRVELELVAELAADPSVRFVCYDVDARRLVRVAADDVVARAQYLSLDIDAPRSTVGGGLVFGIAQRLRAVGRPFARSLRWGATAGALIMLYESARKTAASTVHLVNTLARALSTSRSTTAPCASTQWQPGDVLCTLSLWGSSSMAEYFALVLGRRQVRFALAVHDLVPVVRPQYRGESTDRDRVLFRTLLSAADVVMSWSTATHVDVRHFCEREQIEVPQCRTLTAASTVMATSPVRPSAMADVDGFVLCVSTIEIRKNHGLLLDVWESMIRERPADSIPTLVLAGTVGWLNTETLHRLRNTPGFERHVIFLENPSDHELSWLYGHCAFTVYPSLYEGWGLPVTESLDAGKVCITSNVSTMPEASEGLGVLLDPTDRRAWRCEILGLFEDRAKREMLEARIRSQHHVRTSADLTASVRLVIDELLKLP